MLEQVIMYKCSICGTIIDKPENECPHCHDIDATTATYRIEEALKAYKSQATSHDIVKILQGK